MYNPFVPFTDVMKIVIRILINLLIAFLFIPGTVKVIANLYSWLFDGHLYNESNPFIWDQYTSFAFGSILIYASVFIFVFVCGIYNAVITLYFLNAQKPLNMFWKVLLFFCLLYCVFGVGNRGRIPYSSHASDLVRYLTFFTVSLFSVLIHYGLVDIFNERIVTKKDKQIN